MFQSQYVLKHAYIFGVVVAQHEALVEALAALLGVEGRAVQHHATLLALGHLLAEGPVAPQRQHRGTELLEHWPAQGGGVRLNTGRHGVPMHLVTSILRIIGLLEGTSLVD